MDYLLFIKNFSTIVVKMFVLIDVARSAGKNMPIDNIPLIYEGGIHKNCMDHTNSSLIYLKQKLWQISV